MGHRGYALLTQENKRQKEKLSTTSFEEAHHAGMSDAKAKGGPNSRYGVVVCLDQRAYIRVSEYRRWGFDLAKDLRDERSGGTTAPIPSPLGFSMSSEAGVRAITTKQRNLNSYIRATHAILDQLTQENC